MVKYNTQHLGTGTRRTKRKRDCNRFPRPQKQDVRSFWVGLANERIVSGSAPGSMTDTPITSTIGTTASATANAVADPSDGFQHGMSKVNDILYVLERIYHRNRNQHRNQHWWRALGLLKKYVRLWIELEVEIVRLRRPRRISQGGAKNDKRSGGHDAEDERKEKIGGSAMLEDADNVRRRLEKVAALEVRIQAMKVWIRDVIVPKAYVAFSSVVTEKNFASLGLVLLACAADISGVVGLPTAERMNELESTDMAPDNFGVLAVYTESMVRTGSKAGIRREEIFRHRDAGNQAQEVDVGEVVQRSQPVLRSTSKHLTPEPQTQHLTASSGTGHEAADDEPGLSKQSVMEDKNNSDVEDAQTCSTVLDNADTLEVSSSRPTPQ